MWARLVTLYNRVLGRRYWQAASPFGTQQLGFMSARAARTAVRDFGGRVSFVDLERAVIFYDTHIVPKQNQE
jgi:hypothetical protein